MYSKLRENSDSSDFDVRHTSSSSTYRLSTNKDRTHELELKNKSLIEEAEINKSRLRLYRETTVAKIKKLTFENVNLQERIDELEVAIKNNSKLTDHLESEILRLLGLRKQRYLPMIDY